MNFSVKESGELLDADHISEEKMALGISEAVYENAICISPLKGNTGAEIVREVQKQMTAFRQRETALWIWVKPPRGSR